MYIFLGFAGLGIFFTFLTLSIVFVVMKKPKKLFFFLAFSGLLVFGAALGIHTNQNTGAGVDTGSQASTNGMEAAMDVNSDDASQYVTSLRDIYAEKERYLEKEIILGPLKIMDNDVENGLLRVNPSLGKGFLEYDSDVHTKIYYKHLENEKKWRNIYADDRPIVYVKGIVKMYSNSNDIYVHASEISEVFNENWVMSLNNASEESTNNMQGDQEDNSDQSPISYHGLGIPREAITRQFSGDEYGFVFEEQGDKDGIPVVIGKSAKIPTAVLSIIGYKDNIKLVGLAYGIDVTDNSAYGNERAKETVKVEFDLVQKLFPDKFPDVIAWSASTLNQIDSNSENGWGPFINTYDQMSFNCSNSAANKSAIKLITIQHVKDDVETTTGSSTSNDSVDKAFISEEEAVNSVLSLSEVAEATGGEASYMVEESPTGANPYYVIRVFNDYETHIVTVNFYTVDAYTGEIVAKEF